MPGRDYVPPEAEFTPIPDADIAVAKPGPSFLMGELRDGVYHALDVLYDRDRHQPELAHNHNGVNSAHIVSAPNTSNLISAGVVTPLFDFGLGGLIGGAAFQKWLFKNAQATYEGILLTEAKQWAMHTLVDRDRPEASLSIFGARCDLVVSCYVKSSAPLDDGLFSFGLVDAGEDPEEGEVDFPPKMRIPVPATVIGTEWRRVWAVLDNVAADWKKNSVRFAIRCDNSPVGGHLVANYFDVRPGRSLDFYVHGYQTDLYARWKGMGIDGAPPFLDEQVSIDDAIPLGAI